MITIKKISNQIINLLFPIECINCGTENYYLCNKCKTKLKFKITQKCIICNKLNVFGEICPYCKKKSNINLNGIVIANDYNNKINKKLIKTYKYNFSHECGEILKNNLILFFHNLLMLSQINKKHPNIYNSLDKILIIPVPLHKKRQNWRGFNQAEVLAMAISKEFKIKINTNDLKRKKQKKLQSNLNKNKRQKNIKSCFSWKGESLKKQNIILVDDVITTGATLNECAKILKQNEAGQIWALVLAKG